MSSVMENRAAVFTSQPQVVEVQHAGIWCAGELLGWRHDDAGSCEMWVRVVVDGTERTIWTDLAAVRLPEPSPAPVQPPTQAMPAQAPSSSGESGAAVHEATAGLPLVRDAGVVRAAIARPGGRRRAPEVDEGPAAPAPATAAGRHRAPVTAPTPAVGRHRAADTGHLAPVVTGGSPPARSSRSGGWAVPAARAAHPVERRPLGHGWTPPADLEPDLLTRPMRLSDQVPHARRPRLDGAVSA
ncbi:hypothetical protein E9529_05485 [Blastococcus sp. KM273128]|uniref:hypothetical protein n=1 Tax=Blastococcus sp. KM273128 TaxID=2570314 RepID=UPI001F195D92|nr:hypothetical protein [Blastococcus sp. KM273128]MCF6743734.1 hypothetical protein [Blastococcus sp. KM273128]